MNVETGWDVDVSRSGRGWDRGLGRERVGGTEGDASQSNATKNMALGDEKG